MNITPKDRKFYLSIVAIVLVCYALSNLFSEDDERSGTKATANEVSSFSTGYTKWEMNEQGKPKQKLVADKVTQYKDKTSRSVNPVMSFYNEKAPPWVVKSETSTSSADGKDVFLQGKAIVSREKAEGVKELIINTSNLRVKPETNYAETDEWAELLNPPNVTTGTGMTITFVTPVHLVLLSNVKGKYIETQKSQPQDKKPSETNKASVNPKK